MNINKKKEYLLCVCVCLLWHFIAKGLIESSKTIHQQCASFPEIIKQVQFLPIVFITISNTVPQYLTMLSLIGKCLIL